MKQIVIIKDSKAEVKIFTQYLIVKLVGNDTIIAYRHIEALYINKLVDISVSKYIKLASMFSGFFTDQHGNILAKVDLYEKV